MSLINKLSSNRADFFGPEADEFTDLLAERPIEHMISVQSKEQVEAINALARARVQCTSWPVWQKSDGSIIYNKLPSSVKKIFKRDYLNSDGFVDLESLHICGKQFFQRVASDDRVKMSMEDPWDRQPMTELVACPALSLRLAIGESFDPMKHKEVLKMRTPTLHLNPQGHIPLHRTFDDVLSGKSSVEIANQEMKRFQIVWEYASLVTNKRDEPFSYSYTPPTNKEMSRIDYEEVLVYTLICSLVTAVAMALIGRKWDTAAKLNKKVMDVASRAILPIWETGIAAMPSYAGIISR